MPDLQRLVGMETAMNIKEAVFEALKREGKPISSKEIYQKLDIVEHVDQVCKALYALRKEGKVVRHEDGTHSLVEWVAPQTAAEPAKPVPEPEPKLQEKAVAVKNRRRRSKSQRMVETILETIDECAELYENPVIPRLVKCLRIWLEENDDDAVVGADDRFPDWNITDEHFADQ